MNFSALVTTFFNTYLATERNLAGNTIASYSACMKLMINFACERFGVETEKLCIDKFDRNLIIDFLDHLEQVRANALSTRNQRLAAIKTFFHFLARNVPDLMQVNAAIQAIAEKKTDTQPPPSMTVEEVHELIATPDSSKLLGARDKALLQLFYNSGARVQEVADLQVSHMRCDTATITLTGKGQKTRVLPLWKETVEAINYYLRMRQLADIESVYLFVNNKGEPLTRFGIGRMVAKHAQKAALKCPSLRDRRITPHVFRHTTALHLLDAGNDIIQIKEWLGHADLRTTNQYLEISIERKRKALAKIAPPDTEEAPELPQWKQGDVLDFLSKLSNRVMLRKTG